MAEITPFHLMRLANEHGCSVSREQAMTFLNQEQRAGDVEANDAGWSRFHRVQPIEQCISPEGRTRSSRMLSESAP